MKEKQDKVLCRKCNQIPVPEGRKICRWCCQTEYRRSCQLYICPTCRSACTWNTGFHVCVDCRAKAKHNWHEHGKHQRDQKWVDMGKCPRCKISRTDFEKPCAQCERIKFGKDHIELLIERKNKKHCIYCDTKLTRKESQKMDNIGYNICDGCRKETKFVGYGRSGYTRSRRRNHITDHETPAQHLSKFIGL